MVNRQFNMKFLLDANVPYSAKETFQLKGHQVIHVRDVSLEQSTDFVIARWARRKKAVLVSRDLDFANIVSFPPKNHYGLLVLRLPSAVSAKQICRYLDGFLDFAGGRDLKNTLVIVEPARIRIRRF